MIDRKSIPYTVIGGYLGAGKTTLLNDLLRNSEGLRLAVLVNDFGDVNIDADLIASHDGETLNLANGCICCSLSDGFLQALARLSHHGDEIDHVIVEASGVSDPVKIGHYGAMLHYALDGVIVLADAEQVRDKAANKYVGETVVRQIRGADLLVLNKIDLIGADELAAVRDWLEEIAPGVRVVETTYGRLPMAVLLGAQAHSTAHAPASTHAPASGGEAAAEERDHSHTDVYRTWTVTDSDPIGEADLGALLAAQPAGVLRAKGFVYLTEDPEHRHLLQLVGKRWTLTKDKPWRADRPETQLVFIGLCDSHA